MKYLAVTISAILFCSCFANAQDAEIGQFQWLAGTWQGSDGNGILVENWVQEDESTFLATGCYIVGSDTVLNEILRIQSFGPYVGYVAIVNNQHPVLFTLVEATETKWVFENKEHDFPQRIVYTRNGPDEILAWVEGVIRGETARDEYRLKRVK